MFYYKPASYMYQLEFSVSWLCEGPIDNKTLYKIIMNQKQLPKYELPVIYQKNHQLNNF